MRKRVIQSDHHQAKADIQHLDLERLASVEITSEDDAHPIEAALLPGMSGGWRAAHPGRQTIRLRFDSPQALQRISLVFEEPSVTRTQEYVLRCAANAFHGYREIARQQWNFSPAGSTREEEHHQVNLSGVTELELSIIPDIGGANAIASLAQLRLA